MKLDKELKNKIDGYFDNVSADELYTILTEKYNFPEENDDYDYPQNYSSIDIISSSEYFHQDDILLELINVSIKYAGIFLDMIDNDDIFISQNENAGCSSSCSIPLAA